MALPEFTMRQLLEAGCHFGHQSHRWNPKMASYIFGVRNKIHIMDLSQTMPLLHQALKIVSDVVADGGRVLFVGTKRQASEVIADSAKRSAQYYVNARWLGGMLTNWNTVSNSIKRLRKLEEILSGDEASHLTKKERLSLTRERDKLERALGGIKDMGGTPDLLFVIDTNKESIAIQEANRLNVPVIAILDSNSNPENIACPIPGNDDASRSINLYCDLIARAALDGIARQQGNLGVDLGDSDRPMEILPDASSVKKEELSNSVENEVLSSSSKNDAPLPSVEDESKALILLFDSPEGEADDLKKITGVGPILEKKLNDLGVMKFAQIANFTAEEIEKIDESLNFKGRVERDGWVSQAKELIGK